MVLDQWQNVKKEPRLSEAPFINNGSFWFVRSYRLFKKSYGAYSRLRFLMVPGAKRRGDKCRNPLPNAEVFLIQEAFGGVKSLVSRTPPLVEVFGTRGRIGRAQARRSSAFSVENDATLSSQKLEPLAARALPARELHHANEGEKYWPAPRNKSWG